MDKIVDNLQRVRERVAVAARRAGRSPEDITIVAVTKTVEPDRIRVALKAGITDIGENRVQEARGKYEVLGPAAKWHLIGHLQTNKVKYAIKIFDLIHSVDSLSLAEELDRQAAKLDKYIRVLVEVNVSGEATKYGVPLPEAVSLVRRISALERVRIEGLMTVGPQVDDPELVRPYFRKLRMLADQIREGGFSHVEMKYLSMGMSSDFEVAIEEGANLIRIGTAIFGYRKIV